MYLSHGHPYLGSKIKKKPPFSPFVVSAALCINGRCLNYLGKWNLIILPALEMKVPFNFWRCPGEWLVSLMNLAHSKSSQRGSSVLVSGAAVLKVTCLVVILTVPSSFISVAAVDFHKICNTAPWILSSGLPSEVGSSLLFSSCTVCSRDKPFSETLADEHVHT